MIEYDLVMSGSGVRLPAFVGALKALEDTHTIKRVCGTSGGSIVAAFIASGMSLDKIKDLIFGVNFKQYLDRSIIAWWRYGLCKGNKIEKWLNEQLEEKEFKDLSMPCRIITCDVIKGEVIIFSQETTPNFPVASAVRMSMSIPVLFAYKQYGTRWMVDGGVMDNYAIDTFNDNQRPTIGLKLVSNVKKQAPKSFTGYLLAIFGAMFDASEKAHIGNANWARTICINTGKISSIDFNLDDRDKQLLYLTGYMAAKEWMNTNGKK